MLLHLALCVVLHMEKAFDPFTKGAYEKRKSAFLVHQQISQFVVNNSVQFILKGTNEFNCVCVTE